MRSPLVLIVDDHEDTREMYAESLSYSGFRVAHATNGPDALEKARTLEPDVIATEIGLPGEMDGYQLSKSLKDFADTRHIPIIAVTGWAAHTDIDRALRSGCDSVLVKPCLPDALLAEVQRLLKRSTKNRT